MESPSGMIRTGVCANACDVAHTANTANTVSNSERNESRLNLRDMRPPCIWRGAMHRPVLQRHLAAGFALHDEPEVIGLEGECARRALSCEGIGQWRVMRPASA